MKGVNKKLLERFLKLAGEKLKGKWVIIGGCVLPLMGVRYRTTLDIDIVGPRTSNLSQTLALMEICESLGMPVEMINQAGAYFLYKIEGWEKNLIPVYQGKNATIMRPNATLFILLKLKRFTESDFKDCLKMFKISRQKGELIDYNKIKRAIEGEIKKSDSYVRIIRLRKLLKALKSA